MLDQAQLPNAFTGPGGLFAAAGYALADAASVGVVTAGQCWTLTQSPTRVTVGVEDVIFSVVLAGQVLEIYTAGISLVEQGDGGITYATSYTVAVTALPVASLSADTRCPNRATVATNALSEVSWQQMMTAPRLALAMLDNAALVARRADGPGVG
jgi:hypothetical protein